MKRGKFNARERAYLQSLPAVESVTETGRIFYSDEFRRECMRRYNMGESPVRIFNEAGLYSSLIGYKRIERCIARWRESQLAAERRGENDDETLTFLLESVPVDDDEFMDDDDASANDGSYRGNGGSRAGGGVNVRTGVRNATTSGASTGATATPGAGVTPSGGGITPVPSNRFEWLRGKRDAAAGGDAKASAGTNEESGTKAEPGAAVAGTHTPPYQTSTSQHALRYESEPAAAQNVSGGGVSTYGDSRPSAGRKHEEGRWFRRRQQPAVRPIREPSARSGTGGRRTQSQHRRSASLITGDAPYPM